MVYLIAPLPDSTPSSRLLQPWGVMGPRWTACWVALACWLHACLPSAAGEPPSIHAPLEETCKPCNFVQGAASFGILFGGDAGPLNLRPIDLLRVDSASALPLANPVLTPLELTEHIQPAGSRGNDTGRLAAVDAISHPTLVSTADHRLLMFFAAHTCGRDRWGIAAAESPDGTGLTWRGLGMVLEDESADLHAPSLFHHDDTWYLVPEVRGQQEVRLFRATSFPTSWELAGVLLSQPLGGISVVQHGQHWWLIGHKEGAGQGGQGHVLAVHQAQSPLGPWTEHTSGSLAAGAATAAGGVFTWEERIHRLGRPCHNGSCGGVEVSQMLLSAESLAEEPAQLDLGCRLWYQGAGWDSTGWTHLAIAKRPDGAWLAVVQASQLPPAPPALMRQLQTAIVVFKALALACIALLLLSGAAWLPAVRSRLLKQRWGQLLLTRSADSGSRKLAKIEDPAVPAFMPSMLVELVIPDAASGRKSTPSQRSTSSLAHHSSGRGVSTGGRPGTRSTGTLGRLRQRLPPWGLALAWVTLIFSLLGMRAIQRVQQVAKPFFVQPQPVPVQGQWSRFTLMVMSYDARLQELQWYVRHYSQCPSVGEILVVWNRGPPPNPAGDLQSDVPVRVRVEALNSMNNRFRPAPAMQFRSVLSLDDDILIPCSTIESTFARWRRTPQQLVGYYPRLLVPEGGSGGASPPVYRFEEFVFQRGAYNTILAGAAFMDSATFFPLYSSAATASARHLVDEVFNCDDLLLNFVVANWTAAQRVAAQNRGGTAGSDAVPPPVQLVRPERRIDISRLSGVGISHNPTHFKAAADRCLAEFSQLFGGCPLVERQIEAHYGSPPNCKLWPLDCVYLH